jgi:hypothetical protein
MKRAKTPEQKRDVVERVLACWLKCDHLRLGQLLCNAAGGDPFYTEDFELAQRAELLSRLVKVRR